MQESMLDVVRNIGNPNYEAKLKANKGIDVAERKRRSYLYRILTVAHNLDFSRCFDAKEFEEKIQLCLDLSHKNAAQKADYDRMVRYFIALNKAHGDRLVCDINPDGSMVDVGQNYRPVFATVSTSMKRLQQISDTVPRLKIKEKYQFWKRKKSQHKKKSKLLAEMQTPKVFDKSHECVNTTIKAC